jgi:hypothetical protein
MTPTAIKKCGRRPRRFEPPPPSPPKSHTVAPSSIVGHRRLGAELTSVRAGEECEGFLLSLSTLHRPTSSLRRTRRDAEPSHHHHRFGRSPCHHIPGANELLVAGHFFLAIMPFIYPELIPDVPESTVIERRRRLLDTYTGEPPPSILPWRHATHHAA